MAKSYERVEPTPFDAPNAPDAPVAAAQQQAAAQNAGVPPWLYPALGVLALLALIVVFLLPGWVSQKQTAIPSPAPVASGTQNSTVATPSRANNTERETASAASPFADARAAKARAEAQDLLAELLEIQELLAERGAEEWAQDEMAAIAASALAGDEQYREREFDSAIASYETALGNAQALEASLPERFEGLVARATAAVEALEVEDAETFLAAAAQLEPAAEATDILRARVAALPEVVDALTLATEAEAALDFDEAVVNAERATRSDPQHRFAGDELARLQIALTEQRFNAAMSEGYAALDESAFDTAQNRFERASKLKAGSSEAAAALQELATARTVAKLNQLQKRGDTLIAAEDWGKAIPAYEEALSIDGSLRFAREGLALARPRAALDTALEKIIENPGRLVDDAILREAQATFAEAKQQTRAGPKLERQLNAVATILDVASTPIDLRLRSDGLTEVTVYKVARLGLFEETTLSLRPGEYTAVGTRRGYRDVRVQFNVTPDLREPVYIACSDAI